jgi:acetyl-CoA carboxylase biotin carboxyl carrier protein
MKRATPPPKAPTRAGAAPHPSGIDAGLVREIAAMMDDTDLTEIEVSRGDLHIRVARQQAAAAPAVQYAPAHQAGPAMIAPPPLPTGLAAPNPAMAQVRPADMPGAVKSPMVGTAYRRPSPEAKALVEVGSIVKAGDRILLIEAMKTFNDIVAPQGGTVTEIFVEDGQPVEYGQALLVIA